MPELVDVERFLGGFRRPDGPIDEWIVRLADLQLGVVEITQLLSLGFSRKEIQHRLHTGFLVQIHRGVYAVGRRTLPWEARLKAATLAEGKAALGSHLWGGGLWHVWARPRGKPDVTVPGPARRTTEGVRVHRMRSMHPDDRAEHGCIPVTSLELTCLHLCGLLTQRSAERAVVKAARRKEFSIERATALCDRSRGRAGLGRFRAIIARDLTAELRALSELELRFLEIVRRHELPMPEVNRDVESFMVDAIWRAERVVVELDGFEFHSLPKDLRRDNERNRKLVLAGYKLVRYTWDDLKAPAKIARGLSLLLGLSSVGPLAPTATAPGRR
ncbi:MAG: DUF559 domain-containing protein [Actinomycetota bacterium]|nr:DUF559 domain-containing protein [Actinomycetota bacterium]